MMSLVTAHGSEQKVLLSNAGGSGENSADPLQTPRVLYPADFPSTAELMMPTAETIRRANPFDLSFGKANRLIGANRSILEQNGLVPASGCGEAATTSGGPGEGSAATTAASTSTSTSNSIAAAAATSNFLSKLQLPPALNHSPSIFSNIGLLGSATDGNENALKTADFARLVQQMKESGGLSAQNSFMDSGSNNAPKTADVLNAVLDIHMQTLQNKSHQQEHGAKAGEGVSAASLSGYLNSSLFNMPTPAGSAPNSAGVLASLAGPSAQSLANVLASVSGGAGGAQSLFAPPTSTQHHLSPGRAEGAALKLSPKILFPHDSSVADASTCESSSSHPSHHSQPQPASSSSTVTTHTTTLMSALQQAAALPNPHHKQSSTVVPLDPAAWDPHDVKPVVSGSSAVYEHDPMLGMHTGGYHLDELGGPRSNDSGSSSTRNSLHHGHTGRGRGRSTAEMPPDERRQTILERNKAAAVRYRKRKKEEHDEMITRCQQMEQERNSILMYQTQNAVLRREVERLSGIVKERDAKCACLRGVTLQSELRERPAGDTEMLEQLMAGSAHFSGGIHVGGGGVQAHLMNGLQHFASSAGGGGGGGHSAKRPHTMHKM